MKALRLIATDELFDVVEDDATFPVSDAYEWVTVDTAEKKAIGSGKRSTYNNGTFYHPPHNKPLTAEQEKEETLGPMRRTAMEAVIDYVAGQNDAPQAVTDYVTERDS
jgi:hypothetical protein